MISSFVKYLSFEKRYSPHTVLSYKNDISQFIKYYESIYGSLSWGDISHIHIRSWMVDLVGNKISNRSINRKLSSLKTFFKFLIRQEAVDKNPLKKVVAPKVGKRLPHYIHQEKLVRLFTSNLFKKDFAGQRDRLVLELLYATGMRKSELMNLKVSDIDLQKNILKVFGKGGKERLIPFGPGIKNLLIPYLDLRADLTQHDILIVTNNGKGVYPKWIYNVVTKYLGYITTAEKKSPHILRHSFATHLTNQGAELNAIKELLGHASLAATQIYTHNSIEKLKKIYEKAHPKG